MTATRESGEEAEERNRWSLRCQWTMLNSERTFRWSSYAPETTSQASAVTVYR